MAKVCLLLLLCICNNYVDLITPLATNNSEIIYYRGTVGSILRMSILIIMAMYACTL